MAQAMVCGHVIHRFYRRLAILLRGPVLVMCSATLRALCVCAILLSGCSNHPLLDDVTNHSTYDVIHKIRCEARAVVEDFYEGNNFRRIRELHQDFSLKATRLKEQADALANEIAAIKRSAGGLELAGIEKDLAGKIGERDKLARDLAEISLQLEHFERLLDQVPEKAAEIAEELKVIDKALWAITLKAVPLSKRIAELEGARSKLNAAIGLELSEARLEKLQLQEKLHEASADPRFLALDAFDKTFIVMQFKLNATEGNGAGGAASFVWPIPAGGTIALSLKSAKATLSRDTARSIDDLVSFVDLLGMRCAYPPIAADDRLKRKYPITGYVGIGEFLATYFSNRADVKRVYAVSGANAERYEDWLKFTTDLNAGTLELRLTPVKAARGVFSADLSTSRKDYHELKVTVVPPKKM